MVDRVKASHAEYRPERLREIALAHLVQRAAVSEFASLADELGFAVNEEEDQPYPWFTSGTPEGSRVASLMHPGVSQRVALAQHHGVPTHLLDWTRNSLVAAFFAAETAHQARVEAPDIAESCIAVWALDPSRLPRPELVGAVHKAPVRLFQCPRHSMSFLHAQDALFTWDTEVYREFARTGGWRALDSAIVDLPVSTEGAALRKYTLPASQTTRLLGMLWTERVFRARLMPTLDNVCRSVSDRWSQD